MATRGAGKHELTRESVQAQPRISNHWVRLGSGKAWPLGGGPGSCGRNFQRLLLPKLSENGIIHSINGMSLPSQKIRRFDLLQISRNGAREDFNHGL